MHDWHVWEIGKGKRLSRDGWIVLESIEAFPGSPSAGCRVEEKREKCKSPNKKAYN